MSEDLSVVLKVCGNRTYRHYPVLSLPVLVPQFSQVNIERIGDDADELEILACNIESANLEELETQVEIPKSEQAKGPSHSSHQSPHPSQPSRPQPASKPHYRPKTINDSRMKTSQVGTKSPNISESSQAQGPKPGGGWRNDTPSTSKRRH